MSKKRIVIISIIITLLIGLFFLITGRARTDVYLQGYEISSDGKTMTLHIGVSSSSGYVRKMKRTSGSANYYFTFYSTFGLNSKLGAKDTFEITLDSNIDEIYFYTGKKGYKLVLVKDENTGQWRNALENSLITITENSHCPKEPNLYFESDVNIYTYCLAAVNVNIDGKNWNLKKYLGSVNAHASDTMMAILAKLVEEKVFDEEQIVLYRDGGTKKYINDRMSILICNTIDGNKDIYIGNSNMEYEDGFCEDKV